MPVTLDTQEAEIRKKVVRSQPGEIVRETLSQKKKTLKRRAGGGAGGVTQDIDPGFKPQHLKIKNSTHLTKGISGRRKIVAEEKSEIKG
jgi:hypothetical protein